jgi:hypothetical protein
MIPASLLPLLLSSLVARTAFAQPDNPACSLLSPAEIKTLVGAAAKPLPVGASGNSGTCMYQSGGVVATILVAKQANAESAVALFTSKKKVAAAEDVTGWATKAYAGAMGDSPIVGLTKGTTFVELKLIDPKGKLPELSKRAKTAMKALAAHM